MATTTNDETSTILQQYDGERVAVAERRAYMKVAIRELREEVESLKIRHRDEVVRLEKKIEELDHTCATRIQESASSMKVYVKQCFEGFSGEFVKQMETLMIAKCGDETVAKKILGMDGEGKLDVSDDVDHDMDEPREIASVPIKMGQH